MKKNNSKRKRNGDSNESSSRGGNGDVDWNVDWNEKETSEGRGWAKNRKKPHKRCRRDQALLFCTRNHLYRQGGVCGHPIAPLAWPGLCTRSSHRGDERVRGTGRKGVRGGIRVGGRNEDGNGVVGGDGDVNVYEDRDGDGRRTGV